ncbi:bacterial transcriptional activator domain-containing protein [Mycobacteroides abscessus]
MNDQASAMIRWLMDGGLKNISKFLEASFGPTGTAAVTIGNDDGTITAYPVNPDTTPAVGDWTKVEGGYTHEFDTDPATMPVSNTAAHFIVVGITSRNEVLIINPAVIKDSGQALSIEGADSIPIMRSWLLQVLSTTFDARAVVTDLDLYIPGGERISFVDADSLPEHAGEHTIVFTTNPDLIHDPATAITISAAAGAENTLLCEGNVASLYFSNRYWPIWRRIELAEPAWSSFAESVAAQAVVASPATANDADEAQQVAPMEIKPQEHESGTTAPETGSIPAHTVTTEPETATTPDETETVAAEGTPAPVSNLPAFSDVPVTPPALITSSAPSADLVNSPAVTALAAAAPAELPMGLYILGPTHFRGPSGEIFSAVNRQGVDTTIESLMVIATRENGVNGRDWEQLLGTTNAALRQSRHKIKKICGGESPYEVNEQINTYSTAIYCDWKHFYQLTGDNPAAATTQDLITAVGLIRGAVFQDIPTTDSKDDKKRAPYSWREIALITDRFTDRCADAALELARRYKQSGKTAEAYEAARKGTAVNPQREDLWEIAADTVAENERPTMVYDLKEAITAPAAHKLRALIR